MHVYDQTLKIIIKQVLWFSFSLSCSILLNAYDTPAERAEWLQNTDCESEQNRECTIIPNDNKSTKEQH